jgi:hypothetical protein
MYAPLPCSSGAHTSITYRASAVARRLYQYALVGSENVERLSGDGVVDAGQRRNAPRVERVERVE